MLNWLTARRSPVEDREQLWVDERFDVLVEWLTPARIQQASVIEPSDRYFPDEYDNSIESVQKHVERLIGHIGKNLEPFDETGIEFQFESLRIDPSLVQQPIVLTASIGIQLAAQALQTGFLKSEACQNWMRPPLHKPSTDIEETLTTTSWSSDSMSLSDQNTPADDARKLQEQLAPMASVLTVLLGLGLFSANTAVLDSGCGCSGGGCGTGGGKSGAGLSFPQFAWALSRFAVLRGETSPDWASHLRLDVKSPFRQAQRFLQRRSA
jgi:hypothetical protein